MLLLPASETDAHYCYCYKFYRYLLVFLRGDPLAPVSLLANSISCIRCRADLKYVILNLKVRIHFFGHVFTL